MAAAAGAVVAAEARNSLGKIEQVVTALTHQQEALRTAFNQNHLAYSQALGAVDGHIAVLRAVINDIQRGDVQVNEEGNVDWQVYYNWYNEALKAEEHEHAEQARVEGSVLMTPEEAEEEIFGGDYVGSGV